MKKVVASSISILLLSIVSIDGYGACFNFNILTGPALHASSSYYIAPLKPGSSTPYSEELVQGSKNDRLANKDKREPTDPSSVVCLWEQPDDNRGPLPWTNQPSSREHAGGRFQASVPSSSLSRKTQEVQGSRDDNSSVRRIASGPNEVLRTAAPPSRGTQQQPGGSSSSNPPSIPGRNQVPWNSPSSTTQPSVNERSEYRSKDSRSYHSQQYESYEGNSKSRPSWRSKVKDQLKSLLGGSTSENSNLQSMAGSGQISPSAKSSGWGGSSGSSNRFEQSSTRSQRQSSSAGSSHFSPFYNDFVPMTLDSQPLDDMDSYGQTRVTSQPSNGYGTSSSTYSSSASTQKPSASVQPSGGQWNSYSDKSHENGWKAPSQADDKGRYHGSVTLSSSELRGSQSESKNGVVQNGGTVTSPSTLPNSYSAFGSTPKSVGTESKNGAVQSSGTVTSPSTLPNSYSAFGSKPKAVGTESKNGAVQSSGTTTSTSTFPNSYSAFGSKPQAVGTQQSGYLGGLAGTETATDSKYGKAKPISHSPSRSESPPRQEDRNQTRYGASGSTATPKLGRSNAETQVSATNIQESSSRSGFNVPSSTAMSNSSAQNGYTREQTEQSRSAFSSTIAPMTSQSYSPTAFPSTVGDQQKYGNHTNKRHGDFSSSGTSSSGSFIGQNSYAPQSSFPTQGSRNAENMQGQGTTLPSTSTPDSRSVNKPSSYSAFGSKPKAVENPMSGYSGGLTGASNHLGSSSSESRSSYEPKSHATFASKPKTADNPLGGYAVGLAGPSKSHASEPSQGASDSNMQPPSYSAFGSKPKAVDNPLSGYAGDLTGSSNAYGSTTVPSSSRNPSTYNSIGTMPKSVDNPLGGFASGLAGPSNLHASSHSGTSASSSTNSKPSYSAFGNNNKPKAVDNPFSGYTSDLSGQTNSAPSVRHDHPGTGNAAGFATATPRYSSETSRENERMAWKSDSGRNPMSPESGKSFDYMPQSTSQRSSDRYLSPSRDLRGSPYQHSTSFSSEMLSPPGLSDRYQSSPGAPRFSARKKDEVKTDWMGLSTRPLSERYKTSPSTSLPASTSTSWSGAPTTSYPSSTSTAWSGTSGSARPSAQHQAPSPDFNGASKSQPFTFSSGWTPGTRLSDRYKSSSSEVPPAGDHRTDPWAQGNVQQGNGAGSTFNGASASPASYNSFGSQPTAVDNPQNGYLSGLTGSPNPIAAKSDFESSYSRYGDSAVPMKRQGEARNGYSTSGGDTMHSSHRDRDDWSARGAPSSSYESGHVRKPNSVEPMRPVMENQSLRRDSDAGPGSSNGQWFSRDHNGRNQQYDGKTDPRWTGRAPSETGYSPGGYSPGHATPSYGASRDASAPFGSTSSSSDGAYRRSMERESEVPGGWSNLHGGSGSGGQGGSGSGGQGGRGSGGQGGSGSGGQGGSGQGGSGNGGHSFSPQIAAPPRAPVAASPWDRSGFGATSRAPEEDTATASPSDGYLSALAGASTGGGPSHSSTPPSKKSYSAFGGGSKPKAAPSAPAHGLGGYLSGL